MRHDLITARHLTRRAVIYQVTLDQVGIIRSVDVTRLSRNCSDWYPLSDLCGYQDCLLADRDGIYDPRTPNGRLLLGLKGQISEMELHTLRLRLTAGLLNQAERGELALILPVGLVREPHGIVVKHPNREVQDRITLVFRTFLEQRSAAQTVRTLHERGLTLPRRDRFGSITWRVPSVAAVIALARAIRPHAGAFVYGRARTEHFGPSSGRCRQKPLPMGEWKICVKDKSPAYIDWETFEKIQAMLRDNHAEYRWMPTPRRWRPVPARKTP